MIKGRFLYHLVLFCAIAFLVFLQGCSDLKDDLPDATVGKSEVHPAGWDNPTSSEFHGKYLKGKQWSLNDCISCHAKTLQGGISQISCFTCHKTYPHSKEWSVATATNFHGKYLKTNNWYVAECVSCHGPNYDGGKSEVSCFKCHTSYPHSTGWKTTSAANFHGKYLKTKNWASGECKTCHGTSFDGGTSGKSCFTCHKTYPHSSGWMTSGNSNFHGTYLKANSYTNTECKACHGTNFDGGTSGKSCLTCHNTYPHLTGWMNPSSSAFHGASLKSVNWNTSSCQKCHGTDLKGGTSNKSCFTCHPSYPHPSGYINPSAISFHGNDIRSLNWSMTSCRSCHGADYAGGKTEKTCRTCHSKSAGPEDCSTCHGSAENAAPPRDLSKRTSTTLQTVGAHQAHVKTGIYSGAMACTECHKVPNSVYVTSHLDTGPPAEIIFDGPLGKLSSGATQSPTYNTQTITCSNTFCHGNFKLRRDSSPFPYFYSDSVMVGFNKSVNWTKGTSEAVCGSCHGLPPTGHIAASVSECGNCHSGVITSSGLDKTKHINGKIDVFGLSRNF